MNTKEIIQKEVDNNYQFFNKWILDDSNYNDHIGSFALIKNRKIKGFFTTWEDANNSGILACEDKIFSIQKIEKININLGYYSYYAIV